MTTDQILESAANGEIDVLFLLGTDPLSDYRDPDLAKKALETTQTVIAVDLLSIPLFTSLTSSFQLLHLLRVTEATQI